MVLFLFFRSAWSKINQSRYRYRATKTLEKIDYYFIRHPALQFSLLFLVGSTFSLKTFFPSAFLWFLIRYKRNLLLSLLIPIFGFINCEINKPTFLERDNPQKGIGLFEIHSIIPRTNNLYLYRGKFPIFKSDNKTYKNIYSTIAFRGKNRPISSYDYLIEGEIVNRFDKFFSFKLKKNSNWIKQKKRFNLNETRCKLKKKLKSYLSKKIKNPLSRSLISSLLTGDVDNKLLRYSFSKLGLSHVLAISGFHFALVIAFFSFILVKILPKYLFLIVLIIISLAYFLFIGMSPSVFRACMLVVMYILAKLLKKDSFAMNIMGVSILINLILIPKDVYHLGFQLSYLSYSAIIIFYPIFNNYLKTIITDHDKNELSLPSKIAYPILKYFRAAISLNLATSFVIFPVLIFYFSKFPIYSLVYNLYIPLLISLLMYLTIVAFFIPFLFYPVNLFSDLLLKVILYPPTACEYTLIYTNLSLNIVLFFLIITFLVGIILNTKNNSLSMNYS